MVGACSSGDYTSGPAPPPTTTTTVAEVTVRGVVAVYSASARVLTLASPAAGVTTVVVPAETEVVRASGAPAGVADLVTKAGVEVTGRPSASGVPDTLVARRIVLL